MQESNKRLTESYSILNGLHYAISFLSNLLGYDHLLVKEEIREKKKYS